jgi:putative FmdB family regulatory protein
MKLHEFLCQDCSRVFEEFVSDEHVSVQCPHCRSDRVKRVLSAVKGRSSRPSAEASAAGCAPGGAGFS